MKTSIGGRWNQDTEEGMGIESGSEENQPMHQKTLRWMINTRWQKKKTVNRIGSNQENEKKKRKKLRNYWYQDNKKTNSVVNGQKRNDTHHSKLWTDTRHTHYMHTIYHSAADFSPISKLSKSLRDEETCQPKTKLDRRLSELKGERTNVRSVVLHKQLFTQHYRRCLLANGINKTHCWRLTLFRSRGGRS